MWRGGRELAGVAGRRGPASGWRCKLDARVERIVAHLAVVWERVFRLTTIEQAMAALGLPPHRALRLRVAEHLAARVELYPTLRRWGHVRFALSRSELRLGLLLAASPGLSPDAAAHRLGVPTATVRRALPALRRLGLLEPAPSDAPYGDAGLLLAADHRQHLGPLGFAAHQVTLADGERFDVPCVRDALLLARYRYARERVMLETHCPGSARPIGLGIERGEIVAVEPPGARYVCGEG